MIELLIPDEREGELFAILMKDDLNLPLKMELDGAEYVLTFKHINWDTGAIKDVEIGRMRAKYVDRWLNEQPS